MRKLFIWFFVSTYFCVLFFGCQSVAKAKSAYELCLEDPACSGNMVKNRDVVTAVAAAAAGAVPQTAPYSALIGSSLGQMVFLLTGVYLGRKKGA